MEYIITEVQSINSHRQGEIINAKNLTDAKRKATKMQVWQGTIIKINTPEGECLAYKEYDKWINCRFGHIN